MREHPVTLPNGEIVPLLVSEGKAFRAEEANQPLVETGLFETGHRFRFRCPICGRLETNEQRMEPVCTGPGATDEHPYEVMQLVAE